MDYITEKRQQLIDEMSRRAEICCAALHEVNPDEEFEYSIDCSDNGINCTVRPKVNTEPKITHIYLKCTVDKSADPC